MTRATLTLPGPHTGQARVQSIPGPLMEETALCPSEVSPPGQRVS